LKIIGIDYSINSPGVCFYDGKNIKFGTLARNNVCSMEFKNILKERNVYVIDFPNYKTKETNIKISREFTQDAIKQANELIKMCKIFGMQEQEKEKNIIVFEGFSFRSRSNRLAQLAGYQYIARNKLIEKLSIIENLYVYSPQTIKKIAGVKKADQTKNAMINKFIFHENKLCGLENHPFYIELSKNENSKFRKKLKNGKITNSWIKPIDDIVDSYWIVYTFLIEQGILLKNF